MARIRQSRPDPGLFYESPWNGLFSSEYGSYKTVKARFWLFMKVLATDCSRANMARIRQSRPDSGLFMKVLETFELFPLCMEAVKHVPPGQEALAAQYLEQLNADAAEC